MKLMKLTRRPRWGAACAAGLATLLLAFGGTASAGIADTRHNLGTGTNAITGRAQTTDGTAEICVFCHTPHGADTAAPAPLWNKRLGTAGAPAGGGTYTSYATLNTPSLDGTVAEVGSVSMACLSCHDGTQAMDNIINAPGSGGYDVTGGGNTGLGWTWTGATATADGVMQNTTSRISMLGTDLSNDHPIGIQYCGGATVGATGLGGAGTLVSGTCKDGDFVMPKTASINSAQAFWIDTGTVNSVRERTDLPLYPRTGLGPMVECGSCHDPHVSTGQSGPNSLTAGETFLRIANAGSAVCLACHVK